ncbi:MAG TPA: hypothetical protein VFD92_20570 [Candidatus Binatia bacterium]|nr:hypothetical protein [Candidatus Binatia bacterium]
MRTKAKDGRAGMLPPEAAFVLQLQSGAAIAGDRLVGRVEHVKSGRAARFRSIDELLVFIRGTLASADRKPSLDDP